MEEFVGHAIEHGQSVAVGKGHRTVCWSDPSGAQVFCHLNKNDEVVCITPSFRADPLPLRFKTLLADRECRFCSGVCVGRFEGGELVFPLGVQIADVVAVQDRLPDDGADVGVRIAFFAENAGLYADEEAFAEAQRAEHAEHEHEHGHGSPAEDGNGDSGEAPLMAAKSFVPGGLFEGHEGSLGDCFLAGTVTAATSLENSVTGAEFWHVRVDTLELSVEALLDPEDFEERPRPGMILAGSFWAVGTFESGLHAEPRKRGLLARLR